MMTKMNDLKPIDLNTDLPACFRIIGIEEATADIIKTVKSYGYDYVDASVITSPFECIPTDEDRMVVILAIDNEDNANSIAKTFHDAGVLTIGLLHNADPDCYDSVDSETPNREFPAIVKAILQPIATQGLISYNFNDLRTTLNDSKHFRIISAKGSGNNRVAEAVDSIKSELSLSRINSIERISLFLYFNRDGKQPLMMQEVAILNEFLSKLPENIDASWAVYPDRDINDDEIKVSIIVAGKELDL